MCRAARENEHDHRRRAPTHPDLCRVRRRDPAETLEIEYPVLLDAPASVLRAYRPETVVAEQVEGIVSLGVANSRMKDFYDLWMIAQTFAFESVILRDAVQRTFNRRRTSWPEQTPAGSDLPGRAEYAGYISPMITGPV